MKQTHYIAEFNFGTLKYDWDDARVADFQNNLDRVNGLAERAEGFIWRMHDDEMELAQTDMNGEFANPRTASTLSVWTDVASLSNFVWKTIHKQFYDRKGEWFDPAGNGNFVMWHVEKTHRPTIPEAMERFRHLQAEGDSDFAFGWDYAKQT